MPELRQNLITRDWVIIATERARRPDEFASPAEAAVRPERYRSDCPFCPGNEHLAPEETYRLSGRDGWQVRVIPNKFPALTAAGERRRRIQGIYRSMSAVGAHEVVIDHPRHDMTLALMDPDDVANVLRAYRQRFIHIRNDPRIEAIIVFKNHGLGAGTSLEHPHSQLAAMPIVPNQIRKRIEEAIRYMDDNGECVFCRTLEDELTAQTRLIHTSDHFAAFIPYAALSPFHTWIFPRRHSSSFDLIRDDELIDLASVLKTVLAKLYTGLNNPDYNFSIRTNPLQERESEYFHWYLSIVPRVTKAAGFELGSGMYINVGLPEESAAFLRGVGRGAEK